MAMDAITPEDQITRADEIKRPSMEEAMDAVRTLLAWAGDDPRREGLIDTPKRVAKAYQEFFAGYEMDPVKELSRTFEDVQGYDDNVAYMPTHQVVGSSKIARVVEIFGKRLQTQETMTAQVADCITEALQPAGVAVLIDAKHQCMTTRGVHHKNVATITTQFTGVFKTDKDLRNRFLRFAGQ